MKLGIILPQGSFDPADLVRAARLAEASGLDSVWVVDNLQQRPDPSRPFLEGWTSLSAAAAATDRIRIGTMVLRAGLRPPRLLAAMAATLERIAPGRLVVGLGSGDHTAAQEQKAFGMPLKKRALRLEILREEVAELRAYASSVPLWLGGESDEIVAMAPMFDGWNYWGPSTGFAQHLTKLPSRREGYVVSWAGIWDEFDPERLERDGADLAVVATGPKSFPRVIQALAMMSGASVAKSGDPLSWR